MKFSTNVIVLSYILNTIDFKIIVEIILNKCSDELKIMFMVSENIIF